MAFCLSEGRYFSSQGAAEIFALSLKVGIKSTVRDGFKSGMSVRRELQPNNTFALWPKSSPSILQLGVPKQGPWSWCFSRLNVRAQKFKKLLVYD